MQNIEQNLLIIRKKIERAALKSGRQASDIILVAVSKTVDMTMVQQARELGIDHFGENRVSELLGKREMLPDAKWHMIGRLQTNKVKDIVGQTCLIHSLDRWKLAEELDKRGEIEGIEVPVLLQVNIAGEVQKAGFAAEDIKQVLDSAGQFKKLKIYGLMTMAPLLADAEEARPVFKELSKLKHRFIDNRYSNVELKYLSMGMSQDYEVAIEEGANIVRVGSALFH